MIKNESYFVRTHNPEKIFSTGAIYNADKTGDRAEPCPTPTSAGYLPDENESQR